MTKKNPGGRPRKPHRMLTLRLDAYLADQLEKLADQLGETKTACIEAAISDWIRRGGRRVGRRRKPR